MDTTLRSIDSNVMTLVIPEKLSLAGDTLYHQVQMISKESPCILAPDSNIWNVIGVVIAAFAAYCFAIAQKKRESTIEAKKLFLDKRIEKFNELFEIVSACQTITTTNGKTHHTIFETYKSMNQWYTLLIVFETKNRQFLSKSTLIQISIQSQLRRVILDVYESDGMTDADLITFASKYFNDLESLYDNLTKSIGDFYEKEISLSYSFASLTSADMEEVKRIANSKSIVSDHIRLE